MITVNPLVLLMVPVIFLSLCGCHDNPPCCTDLMYRSCFFGLTVDSGLFVQLKNFLKRTKSSVGVLLFLLFKPKLWARCDNSGLAGIPELLEAIRFRVCWYSTPQSRVLRNRRASFYSECCHRNKMLLFFPPPPFRMLLLKINKQQWCKLCLVFSAESEVCFRHLAALTAFLRVYYSGS